MNVGGHSGPEVALGMTVDLQTGLDQQGHFSFWLLLPSRLQKPRGPAAQAGVGEPRQGRWAVRWWPAPSPEQGPGSLPLPLSLRALSPSSLLPTRLLQGSAAQVCLTLS